MKSPISNKKPKGIIFDFNGVIIDDNNIQKKTWDIIAERVRGRALSDEEMHNRLRGVPASDTLKYLSKGALEGKELDRFVEMKRKITIEYYKKSPEYKLDPSLVEFLDYLKSRNIPRAIATSARSKFFNYSFKALKLGTWFKRNWILCFDGKHKGKPAPDPYILASSLINLEPKDCYVVEDAPSGIKSAYAAGVRNIVAIGKDDDFEKLSELPGVIKCIKSFFELDGSELFY